MVISTAAVGLESALVDYAKDLIDLVFRRLTLLLLISRSKDRSIFSVFASIASIDPLFKLRRIFHSPI